MWLLQNLHEETIDISRNARFDERKRSTDVWGPFDHLIAEMDAERAMVWNQLDLSKKVGIQSEN